MRLIQSSYCLYEWMIDDNETTKKVKRNDSFLINQMNIKLLSNLIFAGELEAMNWLKKGTLFKSFRSFVGILQSFSFYIQISNSSIDFHNWINFNQWTIQESKRVELDFHLISIFHVSIWCSRDDDDVIEYSRMDSNSLDPFYDFMHPTYPTVRRWCCMLMMTLGQKEMGNGQQDEWRIRGEEMQNAISNPSSFHIKRLIGRIEWNVVEFDSIYDISLRKPQLTVTRLWICL